MAAVLVDSKMLFVVWAKRAPPLWFCYVPCACVSNALAPHPLSHSTLKLVTLMLTLTPQCTFHLVALLLWLVTTCTMYEHTIVFVEGDLEYYGGSRYMYAVVRTSGSSCLCLGLISSVSCGVMWCCLLLCQSLINYSSLSASLCVTSVPEFVRAVYKQ